MSKKIWREHLRKQLENQMSEKDRTRFVIPEKPRHPLGWACENCFHVVKDPASKAMKCCAHPPAVQMLMMGPQAQIMSVSPPVQLGEWCGEFALAPVAVNA
jgi:hypothetical protein